jgi:RNA polymerase-binding transcription factor DksA
MSERDFDLASLRADQEWDAGVARIRASILPRGLGRLVCDCGAEISAARRAAYPDTDKCIDCATFAERRRRSA